MLRSDDARPQRSAAASASDAIQTLRAACAGWDQRAEYIIDESDDFENDGGKVRRHHWHRTLGQVPTPLRTAASGKADTLGTLMKPSRGIAWKMTGNGADAAATRAYYKAGRTVPIGHGLVAMESTRPYLPPPHVLLLPPPQDSDFAALARAFARRPRAASVGCEPTREDLGPWHRSGLSTDERSPPRRRRSASLGQTWEPPVFSEEHPGFAQSNQPRYDLLVAAASDAEPGTALSQNGEASSSEPARLHFHASDDAARFPVLSAPPTATAEPSVDDGVSACRLKYPLSAFAIELPLADSVAQQAGIDLARRLETKAEALGLSTVRLVERKPDSIRIVVIALKRPRAPIPEEEQADWQSLFDRIPAWFPPLPVGPSAVFVDRTHRPRFAWCEIAGLMNAWTDAQAEQMHEALPELMRLFAPSAPDRLALDICIGLPGAEGPCG